MENQNRTRIKIQITWWGSSVNSPHPNRRIIYYYIYSDTYSNDIRAIDELYKYTRPATIPDSLPRILVPTWLRALHDMDIISNHPRTLLLLDDGTLNISIKGGRRLFIISTDNHTINIKMYQWIPYYRIINIQCHNEYDLCWHVAQSTITKMIMTASSLAKLRFFHRIYTGKYNIVKV